VRSVNGASGNKKVLVGMYNASSEAACLKLFYKICLQRVNGANFPVPVYHSKQGTGLTRLTTQHFEIRVFLCVATC